MRSTSPCCVDLRGVYDALHTARARGMKRLSDRKKNSGATGKPASSSKTRGTDAPDQAGGRSKSRGSKWGRVLRTAYDDALREPVPDEFLDLLGKLD